MRCVCCYCGILYNVKPPYELDDETHGHCNECHEMMMHNIKIYMEETRKERTHDSLSKMPQAN